MKVIWRNLFLMSDLNKVFVVPVKLEKHPDADLLSIVHIDGYVVVVRTQDWVNEDRGAYIPPDNMVNISRPEFKFLDSGIMGREFERIKAKRFRGIMSQGLLVPVPKYITSVVINSNDQGVENTNITTEYEFEIGDDATEYFGVKRYESPVDLKLNGGEQSPGPQRPGVNYDIESWFKYSNVIPDDMLLVMTEKIHGTNARFTFQDGEMHVASRSFYRKKTDNNLYWKALNENTWIEDFCRKFPDVVLYGEIYGWVQDLKYGAQPGQIFFRAFDVYENGKFWNWDTFYNVVTESGTQPNRCVPVLGEILGKELKAPGNLEKYMNGKSTLFNKHVREGIVVKPIRELYDLRLGRVTLKAVSPEYLEKAA